jgi:hypothetical protein
MAEAGAVAFTAAATVIEEASAVGTLSAVSEVDRLPAASAAGTPSVVGTAESDGAEPVP